MTDLLMGPYGGMMALSFAFGAAGGWGFAMKTTLAEARRRIAELKTDLDAARMAADEARTRYLERLEAGRA